MFPNENYGDELVLLNGFHKKDDKTIQKHKALALILRNEFLNGKNFKEQQETYNLNDKRATEINDLDNKD